ncbi:hypothetical protein SKAU_G00319610 [Synaphobranchus kaupii]|uniref:Uncharacterized protein n=1 Tax=Synaphobranchus kaupii TaxID=118154 RepID=A0A9Q1ENI2_SYNKA|nr:hypothetical protein SKAU_G00319610 [Synaphobranchus kaupii]
MEETLGQENESLPGKTDVNGTEKSVTEKCSNDTVATVAQPLNHHQIDQVLHIQQERERKRQTHQLYEARRRQESVILTVFI